MNWDALGAVAELVGAVGVVASLLYVAVQVRQNTGALRASAEQDAITALRLFQRSLLEDDRLRVFRAGSEDWDSLDDDDRARFVILVSEFLRTFESIYMLRVRGSLEPDVWRGLSVLLQDHGTSPGVQRYFEMRRDSFSPAFREFFDSMSLRTARKGFPDLIVRENGS